VLSEDF